MFVPQQNIYGKTSISALGRQQTHTEKAANLAGDLSTHTAHRHLGEERWYFFPKKNGGHFSYPDANHGTGIFAYIWLKIYG